MYPGISARILELGRSDQEMRELMPEVLTKKQSFQWKVNVNANTYELMKIVLQIGWPTVSKVGEEASQKAWLLVQHADHDVAFQKQCLDLMLNEAYEDVPEVDIAFLYDRICVNEGRPQFFGTQFTANAYGAYGPAPIELPEFVDERRKSLGLAPLVEYKAYLLKKYNMEE